VNVKEITQAIENIAPLSLQEPYDNAGLIVGPPEMEVSQVLLCLDAVEEVIDEAIQTNCNLVISHHPILFSGIKQLTGKTYVERTIIKAIKNNIAIYAAHTNLDNIRNGVNSKICERLQLKNTKILSPRRGHLMKLYTYVPHKAAEDLRSILFQAGAGVIGNYDQCSFNSEGYGTFRGNINTNPFVGEPGIQHREPETKVEVIFPIWLENEIISALKKNHPYEEVAYEIIAVSNTWDEIGAGMIGDLEHPMETAHFFSFLKEQMKVKVIRHTRIKNTTIKRVAVCGGSGSFLLDKAIASRADVLVTSDFKYHQFFDAEGKIIIADIGHYESEQFTIEIFAEILRQKFPTFAVRFTSVNTNPINYF
jgi:dinuclear metal center YbgI/SA1388 family protein